MPRYDKFNFVFFLNSATDYYKFMFYDAFALSNVRFIEFEAAEMNDDTYLTFEPYHPVNNPAAFANPQGFDVNAPQAFAQDFPTNDPLAFFFWADDFNLFRAFDFFNHLRNEYPACKLVLWLTNPIQVYQNLGMFRDKAGTAEIFATFDCVLTYNQIDAMDFGLTYFDTPYSVLPFEQPQEDVDIFFVGRAMDSLEKILRAYKTFKASSFTCEFYINDVENPPPNSKGLHFNEPLSYAEIFEHILNSRAVLDIIHAQDYGLTLRYFESLAYDKIFITDNSFYRQERFNSPKIFLIDKSLKLDKKIFLAAAKLPNNYRNEYSPLRMMAFLEFVLNA